ncbi:otospiralin-like isoform 1-T1 [Salvelinus alpinus]|nr:otospiralin [Salvelinus alpinus]
MSALLLSPPHLKMDRNPRAQDRDRSTGTDYSTIKEEKVAVVYCGQIRAKSLAQSSQSALSDSMHRLRVSMLVCFILLGFLSFTGAEETETATKEGKGREKREMPNWALWSSDFTGWLQELTAQAGYDRIQDLARTYWAHFPIASYLGYDSPDQDTEESKGVPE